MSIEKQFGFLPEMVGMEKVWDRSDHPGLITGDRAHYKSKIKGKCVHCGELTDRVINYLGGLTFTCGSWCVFGLKKEVTNLPELGNCSNPICPGKAKGRNEGSYHKEESRVPTTLV